MIPSTSGRWQVHSGHEKSVTGRLSQGRVPQSRVCLNLEWAESSKLRSPATFDAFQVGCPKCLFHLLPHFLHDLDIRSKHVRIFILYTIETYHGGTVHTIVGKYSLEHFAEVRSLNFIFCSRLTTKFKPKIFRIYSFSPL